MGVIHEMSEPFVTMPTQDATNLTGLMVMIDVGIVVSAPRIGEPNRLVAYLTFEADSFQHGQAIFRR